MINLARPYMLYAIFLIIPMLIFELKKYRRLLKKLKQTKFSSEIFPVTLSLKSLPRAVLLRIFFRVLAYIMLVLALVDFSWGTREVPVQKTGTEVAFVFDISYSMTADDASGGLTRLKSASAYASLLLSRMEHIPLSVTIAKGDGIVVVPFTEDLAIIYSLLDSLSPNLLSTEGTSLGKGVHAALTSFPNATFSSKQIWLFTDGDETDKSLLPSLEECLRHGVSVSLIGFGSERETEVLSGDGKTRVKTALRANELKEMANNASNSNLAKKNGTFVKYVDASEIGSANELLNSLNFTNTNSDNAKNLSYEVQQIERYPLFLIFVLVSFIASLVVLEYNTQNKFSSKKALLFTMIFTMLFLSCSNNRVDYATKIASGTFEWHKKHYREAIADFLRVAEKAEHSDKEDVLQYALYNLASTYIKQDEYTASLSCMDKIKNTAPSSVLYATYYNYGLASYLNADYESAVVFFREALKIDNSKIDAKINLEIAQQQLIEQDSNLHESINIPVKDNSHSSVAEQAVFQRIRENDQKQWKGSEVSSKSSSAADY
ncbi:MAG: VWA domain-containing protein [Treponema sp.]|nr:VWA domain-containing protein [Treponema sp.]